jgi:hypothetical protein
MVNQWRTLFLTLLLVLLWIGTAVAVTVQAVADRERIGSGESLQLQLRVDGSPDGEPDLAPLQKDWDILSRSQSSQMQIVNSSFSRSTVYSLTLMPKRQGSLTIPSVCFAKDCSLPLSIEVLQSSAVSNPAGEQLLLETDINPQKIVMQGQLLLKVRLLRRVDLLNGQLSEPVPSGVEAQVKKLGDDRSYELRRNGLLYQVIERDYAIFPQESGQLRIPPLQFDGTIASGNSRFDAFTRQGQRVRRTSQPLRVEVTPLPEDLGRRPWLPATNVELQDDWQQQPPKLVVGEPATRTLRLIANGLPAVQLPELKPGVPAGFKSYPDQPSREDQVVSSGIKGTLVLKTALVPTRSGRFNLPAVDLDWWDVSTGTWSHAHLPAIDLDVAPAAGTSSPPPADLSTSGAEATVETSPGITPSASSEGLPLNGAAWFWPWLSLGLAVGWILTLLLLLRLWRCYRAVVYPEMVNVDRVDRELTEKSARKTVVRAAQRHDPRATRQALLAWSQLVFATVPGDAYNQLLKTVEPALRTELERLDRCLYGRFDSADWNGEKLAEEISSWNLGTGNQVDVELPDLYPGDSASRNE